MKKRSFFEFVFLKFLDAFMDILHWFSTKVGVHSFLTRVARRKSQAVAFCCWSIFIFAFLNGFLFLFKHSLLLTVFFAVCCGGLLIVYSFPRMRSIMLDTLPVKWFVQLLDPNK